MAKYDKPMEKDDEDERNRVLRLPYALCKANGINLPKTATPTDAWNALKGIGMSPEREMAAYFEKIESSKRSREKTKTKKEQLQYSEHNPNYDYESQDGLIAGVSKGSPMSFEQADGKNCNPFYGKLRSDGEQLFGYDTNCQTCVVAYEARRRGYDVRALPNMRNQYIADLRRNTSLAYKDAKTGKPPQYLVRGYRESVISMMETNVQVGQRWTIEFGWGQGPTGHIVSVERGNDGALMVYDPQNGKSYKGEQIRQFLFHTTRHKMLRVDNLELNHEYVDYILKGVKND